MFNHSARLWNEIPTKLGVLPKKKFKKEIQMILFNILEYEDYYIVLETL